MQLKGHALASALIFVLTMVITLWAVFDLPDAPMAVHWDLRGRPDSYWPKTSALALGPAMMAVVVAALVYAPRFMPASGRLERSPAAYGTVGWSFSAFCSSLKSPSSRRRSASACRSRK